MMGFWNVMMLPILLFSCLMGGSAMSAPAGNLNVLADGERLQDRRMTDLKTHDTPWTFQKPASLDEWKNKRDRIRRKILISCGLWPMPESGQLKYEIFEKKENEDYTVEKVLLETFPGYYATGNLYRPKPDPANPSRRYPGVLCPHGHWTNARLAHTADDSVLAARSISFARQGYVCFAYDMVGYSDNKALLDHNFGGRREALWGIIPAGFQLYTSLKALDFLRSLPDVEPKRIACTGASGGGTQTFLLYAVDERIKAAAPVNMISAHMQGGCKCENAPQLRLDINNMDIGATMAPRPLMLVCATGDWTKNTPEVEYPAIRSIYELYRKPDLVAYHLVDAEHNYNKESRQAVYNWFARVFYHDRPQSDFVEKDYVMDPTPDLSVFAKHPIPEDALKPEQLFEALRVSREKQLWDYLEKFKPSAMEIYSEAYRETLAVKEPEFTEISTSHNQRIPQGEATVEKFLLENESTGQAVPAVLWTPGKLDNQREIGAVLLIHPEGKSGLIGEGGILKEPAARHIEKGIPVLSIDCLGTGEFIRDASWTARAKAQSATGYAHFATYNLTDTAGRVQDILLAETWIAKKFGKPAKIIGLPGAGGWVLLAHGLAENSMENEADLSNLDFSNDHCFVEDLYIPNLRRCGDFATSILLAGNRSIRIQGCADPAMNDRLKRAMDAGVASGGD